MPSGVFSLKQQVAAIRQGAWTNQPPTAVNYLVVAGGGGVRNSNQPSGGGGAGGLLAGVIGVVAGSAITVTVGAGQVDNGSNSVFGSITATGGGASGQSTQPGNSGGSGGGGTATNVSVPGGAGTSGQGNSGGIGYGSPNNAGGGGGGAGTVGLNYSGTVAGNGGSGIASDISGTRTVYAGGGGGGCASGGTAGLGGAGGGGNGGVGSTTGAAGAANTGGGAGGCGAGGANQAGGSGIVIISYPDTYTAAASTTGSPTVSTSGSGSLAFTGSTSVYTNVTTNSSNFAFGTGDFTIEFWIYTNSSGTYTVYDSRALGANDLSPTLYLSSNSITFFTNGSDRINGGALTNATWNHIALVRIGTSTKLYLNGTQTGSTYTDSNNYINSSNRPFIGGGSIVAGQNPLNGYMTNVRVVKGVGVYTGNFTTPTAPLQATQSAGTNIAAITGSQASLLLGVVSGAYLADSSTLSNTMGVSTAPAWNQLSPFATGLGYKNRVYTWTSSGSITF